MDTSLLQGDDWLCKRCMSTTSSWFYLTRSHDFLHSLMGKANFGKKKRVDQLDMVTS